MFAAKKLVLPKLSPCMYGWRYCALGSIYWNTMCCVLTTIICCIMVPYFRHSQCLWVIWAAVLSGDVVLFSTISLAKCSEAPHHCFCKLVQPQQQGEMNLNFGLPSPAWEERQYLDLCWAWEELCLQTCDAHSCYICNLLIAKPFTRKEIWLLVWNLLSKHLLQFFFFSRKPAARWTLIPCECATAIKSPDGCHWKIPAPNAQKNILDFSEVKKDCHSSLSSFIIMDCVNKN